MKKHPNEKYWQFRTSTQSLWNRSFLVNIDGKDLGRQIVEIGGKFDQLRRLMMDKTDPLPYKAEDDPLVITNKRPLNECEDQSLASEPQTTLGSSRGTCTSPASDNN